MEASFRERDDGGHRYHGAEPSGLWGLLKESFAEGGELVKAKMDPNTNPFIKAVVADFETTQGRGIARDGLKEAGDKSNLNRVEPYDKDNWNGRGRRLCGRRRGTANRCDHGHLTANQISRQCWQPIVLVKCPSVFVQRGLLRARRQRPCCRAAEQRDELAAPHSITSSAVICMISGTVRSSVFAVLRLMASSNFTVCWTGKSAGFSPLRIRPAE